MICPRRTCHTSFLQCIHTAFDHGLQTHTSSDTEVVVLMYQKYRERCVQYFNGMFAFVIYNKITKDVFVARDRLGIKPLYYKILNNQIIYSSEISSILSLSDSPIDEFGIRQYRKFRMTINNHTVYKDINFFPAGYYSLNDKLMVYGVHLLIKNQFLPTFGLSFPKK